MSRKTRIVVAISAAVVAAGGAACWMLWPGTPAGRPNSSATPGTTQAARQASGQPGTTTAAPHRHDGDHAGHHHVRAFPRTEMAEQSEMAQPSAGAALHREFVPSGLTGEEYEDLANQTTDDFQGVRKLIPVLQAWVNEDRQAAADWAAGLPAGERRNTAARLLMRTWATSNPEAALAWAESLGQGPARDAAIGMYIDIAGKVDPATAARSVASIDNDFVRLSSLTRVVKNWVAKNELEQVAQWIETFPDGGERDLAVGQYVVELAKSDVVEAAETINSAGAPEWRQHLAGWVARQWAAADPAAAGEWSDALPDARARDLALREVALEVAMTDPSAATEWSRTIADNDLRDWVVTSVVHQWYLGDPENAIQWLVSSGVPDDITSAFLNDDLNEIQKKLVEFEDLVPRPSPAHADALWH